MTLKQRRRGVELLAGLEAVCEVAAEVSTRHHSTRLLTILMGYCRDLVFKVELGVVLGADSEEVLGVDLEEVLGAALAVDLGAHRGAGEDSAEEGSVAAGGVSESLARCTCFALYRLFLCFLSSHLFPHHGSGNVYDIHT